jgi:hypothetical protein
LSEDKGFLSRWSDRKLTAELEERQLAIPETDDGEKPRDEFDGKSDDEILTILELPAPETLKLGDTVEKFMDGRVPERLRARALRAFWKTNPVLANIDGLDEYCDDYTDAAMIIENMETIYQVGKGYATQALDALESLADDNSQSQEESLVQSIDQSISDRRQLEAPIDANTQITVSESREDCDALRTLADQDQESVRTPLPRPQRMSFN